ncbi:MAG: T9SS type A sorting domain-containing protein [Bacteroidetes bacterium]|nr:T9SS type A sorting domain-containing protein [Bacteroidota bacterium]
MKKTLLFVFALPTFALSSQSLVKDIYAGAGSSTPMIIASIGADKTFILADDGTHGREIWISDGTATGTKMLADINPAGSGAAYATTAIMNGKLYFPANDGTNGKELWVTDGTTPGTKMVKDHIPGAASGLSGSQFIVYKGRVYFQTFDMTNGQELSSSDGTDAGTGLVKDLTGNDNGSYPQNMVVFKNRLFFQALVPGYGMEWWSTDGSDTGTHLLADINPGGGNGVSTNGYEYNGWLYFGGTSSIASGTELWRTNGSTTEMLKNINTGANASSNPSDFMKANGKLFFVADDGNAGRELWLTDGTQAGTRMVHEINTGSSGTAMSLLGELNNRLLFSATTSAYGNEIWSTDGTDTGTHMLQDLYVNSGAGVNSLNSEAYAKPASGFIVNPYIINGYYYFAGNDGVNGIELWRTNGTISGTEMMAQICDATCSAGITWIFAGAAKIWLAATNGTTGSELYAYTLPDLAVHKTSGQPGITVYPNPAENYVSFSQPAAYVLSDFSGKILKKSANPVNQIHLQDMPAGLYIALLKTESGIFNCKLMKK